jgi:hypothetical protein
MAHPGYEEAERRIEAVRRNGAGHLDLRFLNAGMAPPSLARLTWLTELDLAGNGLESLPEFVCRISNLEALNLAKNSLENLPRALGGLGRLRTLDLAYNRLQEAPHVLPANLRTLNIGHNPIRRLPGMISELANLRTLSLEGMPELREPPADVVAGGLPAIRKYLREHPGGAAPGPQLLGVFLCHSSGDKAAVRKLHTALSNGWIDPWLDEEKLLPGQNWDFEIRKAVKASHVVIICLSSRSVGKEGYLQREIGLALDLAEEKPEGTIFVVPARLEDCALPERLGRYQRVDLFEANGTERLLRALQVRAQQIGIPPKAVP